LLSFQIATSEPPAKAGAGLPSGPGIGKVPHTFSMSGLSFFIAPCCQLPAKAMAALPVANWVRASTSFQPAAAGGATLCTFTRSVQNLTAFWASGVL
jgi:hypothetical protein